MNSAIRQIRAALDDPADSPRYIETVPKRGYRFLGTVTFEEPQPSTESLLAAAPGPTESDPETPPSSFAPAAQKLAVRRWAVPGLAVLSVLLILAVTARLLHAPRRSAASEAQVRIAVLPFANLTGEGSQDYISDGFTEEMITKLGQLEPSHIAVIARTSSMSYKGSNKPISQIAQELRVDYVLEGSVRTIPSGFRVTAQLIRADSQMHVWAHDYDRSFEGLVPIQAEVAQAVAEEIQAKLTPASHVVLAKSNEKEVDSDSYRAYLRGNFLLADRTEDSLTQAVASFQDAIDKDPTFAPAYSGLADAYNLLIYYGYPPGRAAVPKAKVAAEKAIELDPGDARGHASLAYVYFMWEWRLQDAEQEFQKAIELNPNYSPAHHWYAQLLASLGRADESLAQIRIAEELDPRSLIVTTAHGYFAYFARRYDEAASQCQHVLQENPNFIVAHSVLGLVEEQQNQPDRAIAEFEKAMELSKFHATPYLDYLGHAYAVSGKRKQAEDVLAELDAQIKQAHAGQAFRAATLLALGRKQQALRSLEEGFVNGEGVLSCIRVDPRFDALHNEPRFIELANRFRIP